MEQLTGDCVDLPAAAAYLDHGRFSYLTFVRTLSSDGGRCQRADVRSPRAVAVTTIAPESPVDRATPSLSLAEDQIGLAFNGEALTEAANAAEVVRQGEALKDALLGSVSHDLRTPLATIRAAAGSIVDPDIAWSGDERRAAAGTIDLEADRLNGLDRNLLDMSRIEGGALRPSLEVLDVEDLVHPVVSRLAKTLEGHTVELWFEAGLPPVDPAIDD